MKLISLIFISSLLLATSAQYKKGNNLYFQKGCSNCHGTNAEGSSYYPKLANKKQFFLIKKLKEFREGKASSQTAEIMFTFANSLTQKEINNLVIFLSQHKKDTSNKYKIDDDILGSVD